MKLFSTPDQMARMRDILTAYSRLPFSGNAIPGSVMESVLGRVRAADVVNTYEFVDVVKRDAGLGWQVKATAASTPVT